METEKNELQDTSLMKLSDFIKYDSDDSNMSKDNWFVTKHDDCKLPEFDNNDSNINNEFQNCVDETNVKSNHVNQVSNNSKPNEFDITNSNINDEFENDANETNSKSNLVNQIFNNSNSNEFKAVRTYTNRKFKTTLSKTGENTISPVQNIVNSHYISSPWVYHINPDKHKPKTPAQRSKEYRERLKLRLKMREILSKSLP